MRRALLAIAGLATAGLAAHNVWAVRRLRRNADEHDRSLALDATVGVGGGPPLRLVVLGDSYPAGMGLTDPGDAFPHQLARRLASESGREVVVHSRALRGARTADVTEQQVPGIGELRPDVVAVLVGANDALGRRRPGQVRSDTRALLEAVRAEAPDAQVVLGRAADLGDSPALPWPLRHVISLACSWTARAQGEVADELGVAHDRAPSQDPEMFGIDGFHGSPTSHAIAAELAMARVRLPSA